jgi:uncharacterized protein (DUF2062 family)
MRPTFKIIAADYPELAPGAGGCCANAPDAMKKRIRHLLSGVRDVRSDRSLRLFGRLLHNANLWHLNRYSVSWAVSVGLFIAFVPLPFQMVLAAAAAIVIGCNLPISVVMVWFSNPITIPPLFYAAYKLGAWLLNQPARQIRFEMSIHWLMSKLDDIWQPLLLGCLLMGLAAALIGHAAVRIIWRIHVVQSWRERQARHRALTASRGRSSPTSHRADAAPGPYAAPDPRRGSPPPGSSETPG